MDLVPSNIMRWSEPMLIKILYGALISHNGLNNTAGLLQMIYNPIASIAIAVSDLLHEISAQENYFFKMSTI